MTCLACRGEMISRGDREKCSRCGAWRSVGKAIDYAAHWNADPERYVKVRHCDTCEGIDAFACCSGERLSDGTAIMGCVEYGWRGDLIDPDEGILWDFFGPEECPA